jgi:hypothetical protein
MRASGSESPSGFGEDLFEGELLEAFDAGEVPAGLDHLADEEGFVLAFGAELGGEALGEGIELGLVLVGEDEDGSGCEPMLQGISCGDGAAFGR